jgi:CHU_C Type IX secretion signal domain
MKIAWVIIGLFPLLSMAQNLVPNPSFECGEDLCDPFTPTDVAHFSKYACEWSVPSWDGTSDIHSTKVTDSRCFTKQPNDGDLSVGYKPGSQTPRTGRRFAGMYSYSMKHGPAGESYREYIQVKLNAVLVPGDTYCAEMFASAAENQYYFNNNLGMSFINEEITRQIWHSVLPLTPQIVEKRIISDTLNWAKIGGTFIATGPAKYLVIGNFFDDEQTDATIIPNKEPNYHSYYFIDDVKVEKLPYDKFTLTADTVICQRDSIVLSANVGVDGVYWTPLEDTTNVLHVGKNFKTSPSVTTTYRVFAQGCNKRVVDTITVAVNLVPSLDLGKDTTICKGTSIRLKAADGFENYKWQDSSSGNTLDVSLPGKYRVDAKTGENCVESDEIQIDVLDAPQIDLGNDAVVCGEIGPLKAGTGNEDYRWSTGSAESEITPAAPGQYWVEATNRCGQTKDTVNIYSVEDIFVPNVLTVNSDGLNEQFRLVVRDHATGNFRSAAMLPSTLRIFDRWGREIFTDERYRNNWPRPNLNLTPGDYFYYITFSDCKTLKGWLQIMK